MVYFFPQVNLGPRLSSADSAAFFYPPPPHSLFMKCECSLVQNSLHILRNVEDFPRQIFYANLTKPLFMKTGLVPFFIKSGTNFPRHFSTRQFHLCHPPSKAVPMPAPREASGGVSGSFLPGSELKSYTFYPPLKNPLFAPQKGGFPPPKRGFFGGQKGGFLTAAVLVPFFIKSGTNFPRQVYFARAATSRSIALRKAAN